MTTIIADENNNAQLEWDRTGAGAGAGDGIEEEGRISSLPANEEEECAAEEFID